MTKNKWILLSILAIAQSIISITIAWSGGFTEEAYRTSITFTMRCCTVFFCVIYMSRGLHVIFNSKATRFLLANRKVLGLFFSYAFVFHLCQLTFLHDQLHIDPLMLGVEMIPLAFINVMGITSIPIVEKNMSRRLWKFIHRWGSVIIWIALFKNYLLIYFVPSVLGDRSIFYVGSILVAITPLVRFYLIIRKRNRMLPSM